LTTKTPENACFTGFFVNSLARPYMEKCAWCSRLQ